MVLPIVDNVVRVDVGGTYNGQAFQNVLHVKQDPVGVVTATDLADLETTMNTSGSGGTGLKFLSGIYAPMDAGLLVSTVTFTTYNGASSIRRFTALTAAGASVDTDEGCYLAAVVKLGTSFANRRRQGRVYLPGINKGMLDATNKSFLDATFRAGLATKFAAAVNGLPTIGTHSWELCVFSRTDLVATPVASVGPDAVVGIQRRRRQ